MEHQCSVGAFNEEQTFFFVYALELGFTMLAWGCWEVVRDHEAMSSREVSWVGCVCMGGGGSTNVGQMRGRSGKRIRWNDSRTIVPSSSIVSASRHS